MMQRVTVILIAGIVAAGCASKSAEPASPVHEHPTTRPSAIVMKTTPLDEHPINVGVPKPAPIAEGPLPLAYVYTSGGPVRVVDLTTGSQVAASVAPARTLVRIDAKSGVLLGKEMIAAGPLTSSHRYGIFLDVAEPIDNTFSSQSIRR
jgi:hypothetical protein